MTTREFDPVFSAALRNELEALADGATAAPTRARRPLILSPQLWIALVTALVLIGATIGVLRVTHAQPMPAGPGPQLVDPLTSVTEPGDTSYVARSVRTLLHSRSSGQGTDTFDLPADVKQVRVYLACSADVPFAVAFDGDGKSSGGCSREIGGSFGLPLEAGEHDVTVTVKKGTDWALLVIAEPAPTVSAGALIDPLTQVRDRRDPDALTGDTTPLLQLRGDGGGAVEPARLSVPQGVSRVRVFLACQPASAETRLVIDGHVVSGCQNAIAHWFDFTPSARTVAAQVQPRGTGSWSLLVVPAPTGAKDSPANALLPYPSTQGALLARARGVGAQATGTYVAPSTSVLLTLTCRGTGWIEVQSGGFGTSTRGNPCSTKEHDSVGFGGADGADGKHHRWTVTPHGDISWTFQLTTD